MSIYGTGWSVDSSDHGDDCPRWDKAATREAEAGRLHAILADGTFWSLRDGTCQCGPITYAGSHIFPNNTDAHGGHASIGFIPGFIERPGQPPLNTDCEDQPYHPWMRLSVNGEDVVLNRTQVADLSECLTFWLEHTSEAS